MKLQPDWPESLKAENAINDLAIALYQARCIYFGRVPAEEWTDVPYNHRILYHEVAVRIARTLDVPSKEAFDERLKEFANAIARTQLKEAR